MVVSALVCKLVKSFFTVAKFENKVSGSNITQTQLIRAVRNCIDRSDAPELTIGFLSEQINDATGDALFVCINVAVFRVVVKPHATLENGSSR